MAAAPLLTLARHSVRIALVAATALLVLVDLAMAGVTGTTHVELVVVLVANALVAAGCVAARGRHLPVALAVIAASTGGVTLLSIRYHQPLNPSLTALAAAGLLGALAVRSRPLGEAAAASGIAGLAVVTQPLRFELGYEQNLFVVLFGACYAIAIAAGAYLRWLDWQRDEATAAARRDERLDLARELHDLVAHYVTGIVVQAQAAQVVGATKPEAVTPALAAIERAGADALASMRRLVGSLRDDGAAPAEPTAGLDGIAQLVADTAGLGVAITLRTDGVDPGAVPATVAASANRIVRESITNVLRHGNEVHAVDVVLAVVDGALVVTVRDDGRPSARPIRVGGFGVVGMTERAEAMGGRLTAGPTSAGWTVEATLPLRDGPTVARSTPAVATPAVATTVAPGAIEVRPRRAAPLTAVRDRPPA